MMRFLLAGVALTLTATFASADTNVERLRQLSLAMNDKMTETIVLKVPEARDYSQDRMERCDREGRRSI